MRIKTCQVCGKQYDACKTPSIAEGYFRWQDVACSAACATKYLVQKEEAAKATKAGEPAVEEPKKQAKKAKKNAPATNEEVEIQP